MVFGLRKRNIKGVSEIKTKSSGRGNIMNEHKFMIYLGLTLVGLGVLLDTPLSFPLVLVGNLFIIFYSIMDRNWELAIITFFMLWFQSIRILLGGL
jgi:hypothetical protein